MRFASLIGLSLVTTASLAANASASDSSPVMPGDSVVTYTFDDLRVNCGWNVTTSGLYADLVFPSSVYMAPCNTPNGTVGLVPSREGVAGRLEVRVQLPGPAVAVSIQSYMYGEGEAPTLIAYDSTGVELARMSDGTLGSWVTLEVTAESDNPIVEVGLLMPQLRSYLDNIRVTPLTASLPEPDVQPEPEPQSEPTANPTVRSDCTKGGWMTFGFRNQGQCERFVMNGKDSR